MATPSGADLVAAVRRHLGAPYVYGAEGPSAFDCSGLIQYAFGQAGVKGVPRTSEAQWGWSALSSVTAKDLQQGDLVFSDWPGDGASPGHVGLYAGNGKIVEASRPGTPVRELELNANYKAHVKGYKRLTGTAAGTAGADSGSSSDGTGLGAIAAGLGGALGGIGSELVNASKFVSLLLLPQTWLRIAAALIGAGAVGAGVWLLLEEAGGTDG